MIEVDVMLIKAGTRDNNPCERAAGKPQIVVLLCPTPNVQNMINGSLL